MKTMPKKKKTYYPDEFVDIEQELREIEGKDYSSGHRNRYETYHAIRKLAEEKYPLLADAFMKYFSADDYKWTNHIDVITNSDGTIKYRVWRYVKI